MTPAAVQEPSMEGWSGALHEVLRGLKEPTPPFRFEVMELSGYDHLLDGGSSPRRTIEHLAELAQTHGRVILSAPAGSGKTSVLTQLFKNCANSHFALFINLRDLHPATIPESLGSGVAWMRVLMEQLGSPMITEEVLAALPGDRPRLLLVDGLSEVPGHVADQILAVLDHFASRNPNAGFVVADRLTRRAVPSGQWAIATVAPIDSAQIQEHDLEPRPLLTSPLFLDLAIQRGFDSATGSEALRSYFTHRVGLDELELDRSASAALDMYLKRQSRTFDILEFEERAGRDSLTKLQRGGALTVRGEESAFAHHLFHDFLVSVPLAANPTTWNRTTFNAVTFRASSFDVLALTLEQVPAREQAELFLRRIYDWNFYGSAYALAKVSSRGAVAVGDDMETVLLAMLAERRWDIIDNTSQRVTDALRLFGGEAAPYLRAETRSEVVSLVEAKAFDDSSFEAWKRLFTIPDSSLVGDEIVEWISDEDSILGWATANALKRAELSASQESRLRLVCRTSDSDTIRWRVVHALGAHPSVENIDLLVETAGDEDEWVRYGAVRSLVECAALSPSRRPEILSKLKDVLTGFQSGDRAVVSLASSVVLRQPPVAWPDDVAEIVEMFWVRSQTADEQDRWSRVAHRVLEASGQVTR